MERFEMWMFPLKKISEVKVLPDKDPGPVKPVEESDPEPQFDTDGVTEQSTVQHNKFGTGIVTQITETKIYVEFGGQQRIFPYPDAFEKGWLTF